MSDMICDAILVVGFGGPEARQDVVPFLENVVRGRPVPRARILEVAKHYDYFGGRSPFNAQVRQLIAALRTELRSAGIDLPIYWGNRNWHPLLRQTVREMAAHGVGRALAWVMSAYGSYSGCRQYLEDIEAARAEVGTQAPQIDKLRLFYNHPGFIEATAERVREAFAEIPPERRSSTPILYTAHSIPVAMARTSPYEMQLRETARLVSEHLQHERYHLVYQSRSGPPAQPWLEPDVKEAIESLRARAALEDLVVAPIGFLNDHLEVLYDLDVEVKGLCDRLGIHMVRAATVGAHPRFVRMIRELIEERIEPDHPRPFLGTHGPSPDRCPADCCRYRPQRP